MSDKKALIVIDIQNDFCPGGSLAVNEGDQIVPVVNKLMEKFDIIAATQDWHPQNQVSFSSNNEGTEIFDQIEINSMSQTMWPDHCVQGTQGAEFHKDLNTLKFTMILRKGMNPDIDSYSGFKENDRKIETGLHGYLKALSVKEIYLCGLATDVCVFYTAMDSVEYGFKTYIIRDACRGIDNPEGSLDKALREMKEKGIIIKNSNDI